MMHATDSLRPFGLIATALVLATSPLSAQDTRTATSAVFSRYADHVVKIEVIETGSGAKASMGSGFFVSGSGDLVTNYHVVAAIVQEPERYRAVLVHAAGSDSLSILAVDVVHDLAVLHAAVRPDGYFDLAPAPVQQGQRLYSLGHPNDLGLSIVEGTYNGHLQHTLYPKIHFTGSINPGMSGGPTISADGRIVGVNVSTAGDQVSFLVPAERVASLVTSAMASDSGSPDLLATVGEQIRAYQDEYLEGMFAGESPTVRLGPFEVVTEPAPFFRCWGDAERTKELPYEHVFHRCSTDDYLYISDDQRSGVVSVAHELLTTDVLSATRFFAIYSGVLQRDNTPSGTEENVTSWRCATRNVRNASTSLRTVLCVRRYRKLDELYDAVLKVAILGKPDAGLVSTLTLSGVTYDNIEALTARYLERITWQ